MGVEESQIVSDVRNLLRKGFAHDVMSRVVRDFYSKTITSPVLTIVNSQDNTDGAWETMTVEMPVDDDFYAMSTDAIVDAITNNIEIALARRDEHIRAFKAADAEIVMDE